MAVLLLADGGRGLLRPVVSIRYQFVCYCTTQVTILLLQLEWLCKRLAKEFFWFHKTNRLVNACFDFFFTRPSSLKRLLKKTTEIPHSKPRSEKKKAFVFRKTTKMLHNHFSSFERPSFQNLFCKTLHNHSNICFV